MARVPAVRGWWWLFGVGASALASAPCALADENTADFTAGKTASASLRITLTIPPRAQVRTDASGAGRLCLTHIPASFLQVHWTDSKAGRFTEPRIPLASLTGNPLVRDCISLDAAEVKKSDRGYLLISAE